jgi:TatA/E family protein of Tat protein translocase
MNIFSNIGITELVFILLLALVIFGPDRLPELARTLGRVMRDFRNVYANLTRDLGPEMAEIQKATKEVRDTVGAVQDLPKSVTRSVLAMSEMEAVKEDLDKARQAVATLRDPKKLLEPATAEVEAIKDELDKARRDAATPIPAPPAPETALPGPEAAESVAPEAHVPEAGEDAVPRIGEDTVPKTGEDTAPKTRDDASEDASPLPFEPDRTADEHTGHE